VRTDVDDWEAARQHGDDPALREIAGRGAFLPDCDLPWAVAARTRFLESVPPDELLSTPPLESDDALRLLAALRETGIVSPEGEPRPALLRALSGVSDVLSAHERERLRRQHAASQQQLAAHARTGWHTPDAPDLLARLDDQRDDLAAAVRYLCDAKPQDGLEFAANLHYFWYVRGHIQAGRELTETALRAASNQRVTKARGRPAQRGAFRQL
jgi:hypothetical protein